MPDAARLTPVHSFLDRYDPGFICNGSDDGGRYAFKEQPGKTMQYNPVFVFTIVISMNNELFLGTEICKWNCGKLGEAIQAALPLSLSQPKLAIFDDEYQVTNPSFHLHISYAYHTHLLALITHK
jgi:hypothetical protein